MAITSFQGDFRWLSNFQGGVEQRYQAAKCADPKERDAILLMTPGQAKRAGRKVRLVDGWDEKKLGVMKSLVADKFSKEPFRSKLLATGDCHIEEGNDWGDRFWGTVNGVGENHLGEIIMEVRAELMKTVA